MADQKITDLTALASVDDTADVLVVDDTSASQSKKITFATILAWLNSVTQTLTNKTINTASNTITVVEADVSDLGTYQTQLAEGAFADGDKTKLDGIEASADVTDATNVNTAGATMNTDADISGNSYFLDEDNMASDDATKVASQQSIKKYVDDNIATTVLGATDTGVNIGNPAQETTVWSATVPAGALGTGSGYEIFIPIDEVDSPAFSRVLTCKLKYGSTTIATTNTTINANTPVMKGSIIASIFADGATNAQFGFLNISVQGTGADIEGLADVATGTSAEDSTGALTLSVTIQNSATDLTISTLGGYAKKLLG